MSTLDEFYSAVGKYLPEFAFGQCREFQAFTITKRDDFELSIRCVFVHSSKLQLVVDFVSVWSIELFFSGSKMEIAEPLVDEPLDADSRLDSYLSTTSSRRVDGGLTQFILSK